MLADVFHQALDYQQAYNKAVHATHQQHHDFGAGGRNTGEHKLQKLQRAGAQHSGDGQEKGELRAGAAANAQKDSAQNGGTGPGSAGNQAQALEATNQDSCTVVDIIHRLDL